MNATAYIGSVVTMERQRGVKITHALEIAADALGLPRRWVYSAHYGQPIAPRHDTTLGARYRAYMQAKLVEQEARIAVLRAELDAMGNEG